MTYRHGNPVDLAPTIAPADTVTLDRVICCYDDMTNPVDLTAGRALRYCGLAYPREAWWVRLGIAAESPWQSARRCPYRAYAHTTAAVEEILTRHGLTRVEGLPSAFWQGALYARQAAGLLRGSSKLETLPTTCRRTPGRSPERSF